MVEDKTSELPEYQGPPVILCNSATPQHSKQTDSASPEQLRHEAWNKCRNLASQPSILDCLVRELEAQGMVGERRAAKLVYLTVTSRLLAEQVSSAVKGPSSAGKSHTAGKVLAFFPSSAFYFLTSMSPKALAYDNEPLKHRTLVVAEASGLSGGDGAYFVRTLLSEGRIKHKTIVNGEPVTLERKGPTNLLVTTTAINLEGELETRLLSIPVDDSREQTHAVMLAQARKFSGSHAASETDYSEWHALQEWLASGLRGCVIPFADKLALAMQPATKSTRMRRDLSTIFRLVATHAVLHQATREVDSQGRVIATLDDYAVVRELVSDLISDAIGNSVPNTVRETVVAVADLHHKARRGLSVRELSDALGLDKSTVSRRVQAAETGGYLVNLEATEGRPAKIVLGEPLPEEEELLPPPEALQRCSASGEGGALKDN